MLDTDDREEVVSELVIILVSHAVFVVVIFSLILITFYFSVDTMSPDQHA